MHAHSPRPSGSGMGNLRGLVPQDGERPDGHVLISLGAHGPLFLVRPECEWAGKGHWWPDKNMVSGGPSLVKEFRFYNSILAPGALAISAVE